MRFAARRGSWGAHWALWLTRSLDSSWYQFGIVSLQTRATRKSYLDSCHLPAVPNPSTALATGLQ